MRKGTSIASSASVPPVSFSARWRARLVMRSCFMVLPHSPVENRNYHGRVVAAFRIEPTGAESRADVFDVDFVIALVDKLVHEELPHAGDLNAVLAGLEFLLVDDRHVNLAPVVSRFVSRLLKVDRR